MSSIFHVELFLENVPCLPKTEAGNLHFERPFGRSIRQRNMECHILYNGESAAAGVYQQMPKTHPANSLAKQDQ